jgi:hypothetical protein
MKNLPTLFFATGGAFVLVGMLWGIEMAASQDHKLAPAHAHLNLIGFVVMSIYGTFYALSPTAGNSRLAKLHYGLTSLAVLVMVPGIVIAISGRSETLAIIGSLLALSSMSLFLFMVLHYGVGRPTQSPDQNLEVLLQPVE